MGARSAWPSATAAEELEQAYRLIVKYGNKAEQHLLEKIQEAVRDGKEDKAKSLSRILAIIS